MRPAQAGVALAGNTCPVHIAATFADLAMRGYLRIDIVDAGEAPDWLLTRRAGRWFPWSGGPSGPVGGLLRYEKALLRGGFRRGPALRLSQLKGNKPAVRAIGRAYHLLDREAVLPGYIRPGADSLDDDDTRKALRAFRRYLSTFQPPAANPWSAFREYLPYAIAFALVPQWEERFAGLGPAPPREGRPGVPAAGYLPSGLDHISLAAAFTAAACSHIHSAGGSAGHGGVSGHHGWGAGSGGHHGGAHHGGFAGF